MINPDKKLFAVELCTVAIVEAVDADEACSLARFNERDICRNTDMEIMVIGEITTLEQAAKHGWVSEGIPYGGDEDTCIGDWLKAKGNPS